MKPTHVAIHHDPEGRCNYLLAAHLDNLRNLFADSFIVITSETQTKTKVLLETAGFYTITRSFPRARQLDTAAHIALVAGYTRGEGEPLFFGCLDRTLHMIDNYPQEFTRLLANGTQGHDYLIVGRTDRALATHPPAQLIPEKYTNAVVANLLNLPGIDVATGCRILTKDAARQVVHFVAQEHRFTNPGVDINDGLWPYIAQLKEMRVGFVATEGLEFETTDQHRKEIDELGYDEWVRRTFTPENVDMRWERAHKIEAILKNPTLSQKEN